MSDRITGLIAATHTPFKADGSLNPSVVQAQCDHMIRNGVSAVFITGTTGEFSALSVEERETMTDAWVEAARDSDLRVIVHVGTNAQTDACRLAAHAAQAGADGVSTLAPHYLKPRNVEELVGFCEPIAATVGPLPFYYYDIPSLTGVSLSMRDFLAAGSERMSNLAGVKYTNADLMGLQECMHLDGGRFDVLFGCDEALLAGWALGVRGAVGSTYNFAAPIYLDMIRAFEAGDLAQAAVHQFDSVKLVGLLRQTHYPPTAKAVMGLLGVDCGPSRAPLVTPSAEVMAGVREKLMGIDGMARILAEVVA
ncbi:MAG: dihydrodipicolinate synthase family protein [Planctomycetota bacterium]|jgi:N-acetylneuraminate lyase